MFYSLVRRGYICNVSVQLVPKYFSHNCSTDSISCRENKNRMRTLLNQDSNSRQRQYIVPVSNLKSRKIETFLSFSIHLAYHRFTAAAVAPLSLVCHSAVARQSLGSRSAVARQLLGCRSAVARLSLGSRSAVALLSLRCRFCLSVAATVARLWLRCHSCYSSCCRSAVTSFCDYLPLDVVEEALKNEALCH